ncbi:MAG: hypothetical protein EA416_12160 [Trueperaceae bacterium]|nr:MAG: hypothetical protein EA416_12160 [Trueperaceae bacterium]
MQRSQRPLRITITLAAALVVLGACVPGADGALNPPTFRLQSEGSGFVRLDVAAVTAPSATFRVALDVVNPNPVPVRLALLEGELVLASVPSARVRFVDGIDLPARGQAQLELDVTIAADAVPALAGVFADALLGRPVAYRLDADIGVEVFGVLQRFPRTTVAAGEVRSGLTLSAPSVRYDAAASGVRSVAFDRVVLDLAFHVDNTGAVGMIVRAPDVRVALGGRTVVSLQVPATPLPAGGSARVVQELVINPTQLGAAVVAELTRLAAGQAASLRITLDGAWDLEVPGVVSRRIEAAQLLDVLIE